MYKNIKWRVGNRDEIYSPAIDSRGYLSNKYGINSCNKNITKFPSHSFPLWWKKISGAKSYALVMESYDSNKLIGSQYIHWIVVNIKENELYDDQSLLDFVKWKNKKSKNFTKDILWQGHNSTTEYYFDQNDKKEKLKNNLPKSLLADNWEDSCIYVGPIFPFVETHYFVTVFGLDVDADKLEYIESFEPLVKSKLNKPFYVGDMLQSIMNHVVGSWTLCFKYKNDSSNSLENNKYCKDLNIKLKK